MRTRRLTTRLLATASCLALLASCAPGEVEDPTETSAPEPAASVDPAEFAGETLNYVYFTDGPDEASTRELIAEFEEEHDVTVELEILPYADLVTSVQARLSGGDAPDVVRLTSLTDFRADLLNLTPYLGDDYVEEFLPGPLTGLVDDSGAMIAVPSDATLNGPFINVELFEQAGVDLPDPENPWTWEEMIAAAKQVQEATGSTYAFAMDKSGHRVSTILSQYGTALLADGETALDPDKTEAALQPIIDLMEEDLMPRDFWIGSGSRYEGANDIFLAQETPIYLSGNWQVGQFAENAEFEWAVAPNPCAEECGGYPGGKYMAALSESPNPALAAEFIRFMNSTESQERFIAPSGFLPTRVDLAEKGVAYPQRQDDMDVFITDLGRTPTSGYEANGDPAFGGSTTILVEEISEVVVGNKDLPTAITDMRSQIDDLVAELNE